MKCTEEPLEKAFTRELGMRIARKPDEIKRKKQ